MSRRIPLLPQAPNAHAGIVYEAGRAPVPETPRMSVSADGTPIAWYEYGRPAGEAPTIVLVHGYPNTRAVFHGLLPHLVDDFRVVAVDTRGSGDSGHPEDVAAYSLDRLNEDFLAVVRDAAPGERVTYVGHDFGGIIGWDLLAHEETRERIGRFVTFGAPSFEQWAQWARDQLRPTAWPAGPARFLGQMVRIPEFWGYLIPGVPRLTWWGGLFDVAVSFLNHRAGSPRESGYARADGRAQAKLYTANFGERIRRPRHGRIEGAPPILSIDAARDGFFTRGFVACMDAQQPEVVHRTHDGGHWGLMVVPEQVAGLLRDFIRDHPEG